MIAIYYRKDGNACATCCPFTNPQKRGAMTTQVGSMGCERCKHFIAVDKLRMIVTCDREPRDAVFCKKDRALNPIKKTIKEELHTLREWNEEDEEMLRIISNRLEKFNEWATEQGYPIDDPTMKQSPIEWFNALRPKPKQEWNEEDERMRKVVLDEIEHQIEIMPDADDMDSDDQDRYNELISMNVWIEDLPKCIKPYWKPNKKQIDALCSVILNGSFTYVGQVQDLISLKDELKKL